MQEQSATRGVNKWGILASVLLGSFSVILNNSMLNVLIPSFMEIFHVTAAGAQWIVTGFMIPMMVTMSLTGYLSDVYGRKSVYLTGMLIFLLGSTLGSFSWSFQSAVIFRVLQGVGGGLVMPLGIALIFQHFPKQERGLATGIWGVAAMAAPAIGPTLGGLVLEYSSWHMLFLMNIPTALICMVSIHYFLPGKGERRQVQFDLPGFVLFTIGVVCFILGVNRLAGSFHEGAWFGSMMLIVGAAGLVLFIRRELHTGSPLIDLRIFQNPVYTVSTLIAAVTTVSMFGGILLIPLLLQEVQHYSALTTGFILLPQAVMMGLAMVVGGKILDRHGAQIILPAGLLIVALVSFALGMTVGRSGLFLLVLLLCIRGLGLGSIHTPATTAGLNVLQPSQVSRAMSVNNLVRQISGSVSVVVLSVMFDAGRSFYMLRMPMEDAGILVVRQIFVALGIVILLVLPVTLRLFHKSKQPLPEMTVDESPAEATAPTQKAVGS